MLNFRLQSKKLGSEPIYVNIYVNFSIYVNQGKM